MKYKRGISIKGVEQYDFRKKLENHGRADLLDAFGLALLMIEKPRIKGMSITNQKAWDEVVLPNKEFLFDSVAEWSEEFDFDFMGMGSSYSHYDKVVAKLADIIINRCLDRYYLDELFSWEELDTIDADMLAEKFYKENCN